MITLRTSIHIEIYILEVLTPICSLKTIKLVALGKTFRNSSTFIVYKSIFRKMLSNVEDRPKIQVEDVAFSTFLED